MKTSNRIFGLDVLRFLAIVFVLIIHGEGLSSSSTPTWLSPFILDGVSIFFVLSGYLIGGILIRDFSKNDISFKTLSIFWKRRWYRTIPAYLFLIATLTTLQLSFGTGFSFRWLAHYISFTQNLTTPHPYWFFPEAWSLSVEEWFYLTIPALIFIAIFKYKIKPEHAIISVATIIILAVTIFRISRFADTPTLDIDQYDHLFRKQVSTRLDSLMYGLIGAYCHHFHPTKWNRKRTASLLIGVSILLINNYLKFETLPFYYCTFRFSTDSLGVLLTLPFLSGIKNGSGPLVQPITYISAISYSLYLTNYSLVTHWIIKPATQHFPVLQTPLVTYPAFWILSISISHLIYTFIEKPFLRLRDNPRGKNKDNFCSS